MLAADVRTRQAEFVPNKVNEQQTRLDSSLIPNAIYGNGYRK